MPLEYRSTRTLVLWVLVLSYSGVQEYLYSRTDPKTTPKIWLFHVQFAGRNGLSFCYRLHRTALCRLHRTAVCRLHRTALCASVFVGKPAGDPLCEKLSHAC